MVRYVVLLVFVLLTGIGQADAQLSWGIVNNFKAPAAVPTYADQLLARNSADECFNGIGNPYPAINPDGTCSLGIPKHNYSYVWGMVQAGLGVSGFTGDEIWFGTVANPLCGGSATGFIPPIPYQTIAWVCEYGQSQGAKRPQHPVPAAAGDWRIPHAYSYNMTTGTLTDRTPLNDPNFQTIFGLRSAGSLGTEVFLAGPTFQSTVTFASWDSSTGAYHGSCRATAINQIRKWININGVLYAGAGRPAGDGVILRWTGTIDNPWAGASTVSPYCGFQVVGTLPAFPAYLANYGGSRMAATTWNKATVNGIEGATNAKPTAQPQAGSLDFGAGVYLGPVFDADGTYSTGDSSTAWSRIWTPVQYEPDPIVASVTGAGAITYWNGWLWFGTMNNNESTTGLEASCTQAQCYGKTTSFNDYINLLFNTWRATSFWRAKLTNGVPEVQLLYGETQLPALVPGTKTFQTLPTNWTPLYGHSGFGNPWSSYAWSISAGANDLLVGVYDERYVFDVRLGLATSDTIVDPTKGYGADLWRFTDPNAAAAPENVNGYGNFTTYGYRNLLRFNGGQQVILGTANSINLAPGGGWELHSLTPGP